MKLFSSPHCITEATLYHLATLSVLSLKDPLTLPLATSLKSASPWPQKNGEMFQFLRHINFHVADSEPECLACLGSTIVDVREGRHRLVQCHIPVSVHPLGRANRRDALQKLFPSFPLASLRNSASWKSGQSHLWKPPVQSSSHIIATTKVFL